MDLRQNLANSWGMEKESLTNSFLFITGTLLLYIAALGVNVLPYPINYLVAFLFFIFWLGYPIAFYYDRKYVSRESDWTPSRWFYFGFVPGLLGVILVAYYVYKRNDKF